MTKTEITKYMTKQGYKLGKVTENTLGYFKDTQWVTLKEAELWIAYDKQNKKVLEDFFYNTSKY